MTKFQRIKWAAPPATAGANQVAIVLAGGKTFAATRAQVAALSTQTQARAVIEAVLGILPDVFLHLNRNGRWAIATGEPPDVWPEDNTRGAN